MELPASFVDYTRSLLGEEEYEKLAVALQQEPCLLYTSPSPRDTR